MDRANTTLPTLPSLPLACSVLHNAAEKGDVAILSSLLGLTEESDVVGGAGKS